MGSIIQIVKTQHDRLFDVCNHTKVAFIGSERKALAIRDQKLYSP